MDKSTNLVAVLEEIKARPVQRKPYYNEQGFTNYPLDTRKVGAYWPSQRPNDLPNIDEVDLEHYE